MFFPLIFDDRRLVEPGASALGASGEGDCPLHERPDVRLHRLLSLDRNDFWIVGISPAYVRLIPSTLIFVGSLEQVAQFLLGVVADLLVRVEEPAPAEDAAVPAVHVVALDPERALVERYVVQRRQVEVGDRAHTSQRGHMPPVTV